jgi:hypothetical protein
MSIFGNAQKQSRENLATVGIGPVALEVSGTFTNSIQTPIWTSHRTFCLDASLGKFLERRSREREPENRAIPRDA